MTDKAEYLSPQRNCISLDDSIDSPECCDHFIKIDGTIEATEMEHHPANYIDGQQEYPPYDHVTKWRFMGVIQLVDDCGKPLRNYQYDEL